jgi:hypothetical protein
MQLLTHVLQLRKTVSRRSRRDLGQQEKERTNAQAMRESGVDARLNRSDLHIEPTSLFYRRFP